MNQVDAKVKGKKKSCLQSEFLLRWDAFGSPMLFKYEEGNQTYRSATGSCISILSMLFTLIFFVQQAVVLRSHKGTTFTSTLVQDYLSPDFTYEGEEFPIAISLIDVAEPDYVPRQGVTMRVTFRKVHPVNS